MNGRAHRSITTWLLALALAAIVLAGPVIDDQITHAEQALADEHAAKLQHLLTQRRMAAAIQLCRQEVGPGSMPRWTPDDELVCLQPLGMPIGMRTAP